MGILSVMAYAFFYDRVLNMSVVAGLLPNVPNADNHHIQSKIYRLSPCSSFIVSCHKLRALRVIIVT